MSVHLIKQITLQSPVTGSDDYGQPLTGWTDVAVIWADIKDLSGREFLAAAATQNSTETKITVRYRPGILTSMRILHGENIYNIETVLGQDQRWLLLMCKRM